MPDTPAPRGLARVRAHLAGRGEWWWVPLVMAVAVAWIYRDLWHQHGRATGLGWDVIDEYGPDLDFLARDLAHGRLSAWNPFDHGGYSVLADAQVPRYYPLHWLFVGWGAAFGTGFWLIQLEVLLHHAIGGALVHLYLRSRGLGKLPALIGGLALISSTPLMLHKASLILWPLVWVPLVLLAIDRVLARPDWRRGVQLGGAIGVIAVAGSPPGFFYAALVFGPYALFAGAMAMIAARREARLARSLRALAIALGIAAAIVGALCAIVFVPFAEGVALAIRADQRGAGFALDGGLPEARDLGRDDLGGVGQDGGVRRRPRAGVRGDRDRRAAAPRSRRGLVLVGARPLRAVPRVRRRVTGLAVAREARARLRAVPRARTLQADHRDRDRDRRGLRRGRARRGATGVRAGALAIARDRGGDRRREPVGDDPPRAVRHAGRGRGPRAGPWRSR